MRLAGVALVALGLWLPAMSHASDWMDQRKAADVQPHPAQGASTRQTPPDYRWPFQDGAARYEVQVADANGVTASYFTAYNRFSPERVYSPGTYRWRVRGIGVGGARVADWSDWREFQVSEDARSFVLPGAKRLVEQLAASPHPRAFPKGDELAALNAMLAGVRAQEWQRLLQRVRQAAQLPLPAEPAQPLNAITDKRAWAAALEALPGRVRPALTLTVEAAFAWRMTGAPEFLAEAKRRALALAKWNPAGVTGWQSHDQMTREFGYVLALVFDWLYTDLAPDERATLANAAYQRLRDIDAHIDGPTHAMARQPASSHGWTALSVAAAISSLLVGDVADADKLAGKLIPWYYNSISPWGGEEGGHSNGTAYGVWTFSDTAIAWDILRRAVGVDPAQKSWSQGMVDFLTFLLPPGTPRNVFGDAAEWPPVIPVAKRFLRRVDHPLARWYERQTFGEDGSDIWLLMAPFGSTDDPALPAGTGNARLFPSVGMAAMHSDLSARNRMSVYFKSSPYGSFNHSHADQNSFVVHARGKPLLVSSGHYDYYGSPHWSGWYRQTRAHNAITFDGGEGQATDGREASGRIVQFASTPDLDVVTGDARAAYAGRLESAFRTVVYARPGTVIVIDQLKSRVPRSWEWNMHGLEAFRVRGEGQVSVTDADSEALCVEMLHPRGVSFRQENRHPVAPANGKLPQWHGIFAARQPAREVIFVTRLTLDCSSPAASVDEGGSDGIVVRAGDRHVTIGRQGAFTLN